MVVKDKKLHSPYNTPKWLQIEARPQPHKMLRHAHRSHRAPLHLLTQLQAARLHPRLVSRPLLEESRLLLTSRRLLHRRKDFLNLGAIHHNNRVSRHLFHRNSLMDILRILPIQQPVAVVTTMAPHRMLLGIGHRILDTMEDINKVLLREDIRHFKAGLLRLKGVVHLYLLHSLRLDLRLPVLLWVSIKIYLKLAIL